VISLAIDTEKRQIDANTELKGGLALADGAKHIAFHGFIDIGYCFPWNMALQAYCGRTYVNSSIAAAEIGDFTGVLICIFTEKRLILRNFYIYS
jgi:hypothetical protein